jgi:hypothetical protein
MAVLLAEELLLLTLTPKGRPVGGYQYHRHHVAGVTGALFIELEQQGRVSFVEGRVSILDDAPTGDLLSDTIEELARGAMVFSELERLGAGRWAAVIRNLVDDGVLARRRALLDGYRFPVVDRPRQDGLIRELRAAASGEVRLDGRLTALLALAGPTHLLEVVAPTVRGRTAANRRLQAAATRFSILDDVRMASGATGSGWATITAPLS